MELGLRNTLLAGDPRLVDHIVGEVKSQGIFDQFRKECIADVDTKPAYQNLRTRVESSVNTFLDKQMWRADLNKNQLRETLRKHIHEAPYLDAGVERIVDQVVNPKVYSVFMPQIEDVVYKFLGLERPKSEEKKQWKNGCGLKDLLPKDLDPVSPESDKNSLKDVSLDSMDAPEESAQISLSAGPSEEAWKTADAANGEKKSADCGQDGKNNGKMEEKPEEEEEDSPTFEPIDIMNFNESNISNDSHLSGISELTSHRSATPDFSPENSMIDFSNQDSQFSKVSSDSRLSIVTDFGSSNQTWTTPPQPMNVFENEKIEKKAGKEVGKQGAKDSESFKVSKDSNLSMDSIKDESRGSSSKKKENSVEMGREKNRDGEATTKTKSSKDSTKSESKDSRSRKNHSTDKSKKSSSKEKSRESSSSSRSKDENRSSEKKDLIVKDDVKDLKDLYKEKIREIREKKEMTEKEGKMRKKDEKTVKKDEKGRKDGKTGSSSGNSSRPESKNSGRSEAKNSRNDSRDRKKDEKKNRPKKDENEEKKSSKNNSSKTHSKDHKNAPKISGTDGNRAGDTSNDSKMCEIEDKKKRSKNEKKNRIKDDHSSLRSKSDDRRSTDRDGSSGSNGKSGQKNSSPAATGSGGKSVGSNLSKESTEPTSSTSSSEISDKIEEKSQKMHFSEFSKSSKNSVEGEQIGKEIVLIERLVTEKQEISLPIKKRPLHASADDCLSMKKPKFAKNFEEAKKLMKIRRRIEREKARRREEIEKEEKKSILPIEQPVLPILPTEQPILPPKIVEIASVPDEERVQIIEVRDDECDEPYPEIQSHFTIEERSQIILGGESTFSADLLSKRFNERSTLSEMELCIRESLNEMMSDKRVEDTSDFGQNVEQKTEKSIDNDGSIVEPENRDCTEIPTLPENGKSVEENIAVSEESEETSINRSEESIESIRVEKSANIEENSIKVEEKSEKIVEKSANIEENSIKAGEKSEKIVEKSANIEENSIKSEEKSKKIDEKSANIEENSIKAGEKSEKIVEKSAKIEENSIKVEEKSENMVEKSAKIEENSIKADEKSEKIAEKSATEEILEIEENNEKNILKIVTEESSGVKMEDKSLEMGQSSKPEVEPEVEEKSAENRLESVRKNRSGVEEEAEEAPCMYFVPDTERFERFMKFYKRIENEAEEMEISSNDGIPVSLSKPMAPPKTKRKYSTSPLTDILLNSANNNNDRHKIAQPAPISVHEDPTNCSVKKRKIGRPKKSKIDPNSLHQSSQANFCNGENFVMPLSPESDVSATSEKTPSNLLKDDKSRPRGSNQRYTSDDLYKPRPLFSSSSRRSRRSNQSS